MTRMAIISSKNGRRLATVALTCLVIIAAIIIGLTHNNPNQQAKPLISPVPAAVAGAVKFPVYYPDAKKLPAGYRLDSNSFRSPVRNGVSYSISYSGGGKKIVFSLQTKPSDNELQSFKSSYIPLRTDYQTPLGQAEIGAYNDQTLVSLPILNGPWIIITAPPDINQGQLKAVLNSLRK